MLLQTGAPFSSEVHGQTTVKEITSIDDWRRGGPCEGEPPPAHRARSFRCMVGTSKVQRGRLQGERDVNRRRRPGFRLNLRHPAQTPTPRTPQRRDRHTDRRPATESRAPWRLGWRRPATESRDARPTGARPAATADGKPRSTEAGPAVPSDGAAPRGLDQLRPTEAGPTVPEEAGGD